MAKTDENIRASEEFIQRVLERNFRQKVKPEELRSAAERLCEAVPEARAVA